MLSLYSSFMNFKNIKNACYCLSLTPLTPGTFALCLNPKQAPVATGEASANNV